jgi:hypothetical protein
MDFIPALAIRFQIANPTAVRGGADSLKGFHRIGDGPIFLKNLRASLFKKGLSNEHNFDRIHLAGQYL